MSNNDYTYKDINDFLKNRLSEEDKNDFERNMSTDENLRSLVDEQKSLSKLLLANKLNSLKELTQEIHQTEEKKQSVHNKIIIGVGLVMLFSAAIALSLNIINHKPIKENNLVIVKDTQTAHIQVSETQIPSETQNNILPKNPKKSTSTENQGIKVEPKSTETTSHIETKITAITTKPEIVPSAEVVSNPTPNENHKTIKPNFDCNQTQILANISTESTCFYSNEGKIIINSKISGGQAPYKVTILNEAQQIIETSNELHAGKYNVLITDAQNCKSTTSVIVKNKICQQHYKVSASENAIFSPFNEITTLQIIDNLGNLHFETQIQKNETFEWNGFSKSNIYRSGVFTFTLSGKQIIQTGTITVVE
ncbi:MAG: SprB repeat-containing protein [Cytophagales bacterium]